MVIQDISAPNEKQRQFLTCTKRYIAYGGARGGGKSWAVRVKANLLALNYRGIKILIMRKTYPELTQNHILPLLSLTKGISRYSDKDKLMTFPNGSTIKFGYLAAERDILQYQGQEYDIIFIDEATHFSEDSFIKLKACVRGVNAFPKRIYLTCNPGGVGHSWVKRLFIDRNYNKNENPDDYAFIPAKVYDNTTLIAGDDSYVKELESLPDGLRQAWLDGNWDIFVGQYFTMWDREVHVVKSFAIPQHWRHYITMDYGRDMFACYFIAMDQYANAYVYQEIYQSGLLASEAAKLLQKRIGKIEKIEIYYAPPDLWNKHSDTGRSTADIFADQGIYLYKADNNRIQGWYDLAEWLQIIPDEQGFATAKLRIFDNCPNLIRCLPQIQRDEKNSNDCAKEPHEITHSCDALRYFIAGRPYPAAVARIDEQVLTMEEQVDSLLDFGR